MNKTFEKHQTQYRLNSDVQFDALVNARPTIKQFLTNMRLVPATLAILVQCAALISVIASSWLISLVSALYFQNSLSFTIFTLVIMQAFLASLFSYLLGMASWWRWIHFSFPLAMFGMSIWQVPSEFYLAGFIISLSLFWTTFRSQVPFFPSRPIVWQQVAKVIPQNKSLRLIDIGSGLGDMAMHMSKLRPESRIEGIEIAPLPWFISYVRAKIRRSSAVFKMGDYRKLDFASYDVIFAYLSPAAMHTLWEKASQEMHSGSLLISLEFEIPDVVASMRIEGSNNSPMIYVWKIP
ncbi:MAG: class I SAM-dependent methyltransferase [Methylotenera sp.]|nr:class I SAM-dependent methyltransferase [Methylotenera sp.]